MGNVLIAADVLAVGDPEYDSQGRITGWEGDPVFVVEFVDPEQRDSVESWERLALAMGRMSRLFMQIDGRGNVVAFDDLGETDEYTPNFVSDPDLSVRGIAVYADTKAVLSREMGEAMLRALVEELRRLPFDTRVVGDDGTDWVGVRWRPPHVELHAERDRPTTYGAGQHRARPDLLVIVREVRCVLRAGLPDIVVEYLDVDDGWTTLLADARLFEVGRVSGAHEIADRLARLVLEEA